MTGTAHYKRLVLELCQAFNDGKTDRIDDYLTPDFADLDLLDQLGVRPDTTMAGETKPFRKKKTTLAGCSAARGLAV